MSIIGIYYLHENGDLIYKPGTDSAADIRESDFAKSLWFLDPDRRENAWQIIVESLSIGAKKERVFELAKKWKCSDEDAINYADYLGVTLGLDGNSLTATLANFVNLQEDPCGFGNTYLEALSDLCGQLGYKGGKMWNATFKDLCEGR